MKPSFLRIWDRIVMGHHVAGLIVVCFIGMAAALVRWHALDDWCARQLED